MAAVESQSLAPKSLNPTPLALNFSPGGAVWGRKYGLGGSDRPRSWGSGIRLRALRVPELRCQSVLKSFVLKCPCTRILMGCFLEYTAANYSLVWSL